MTDYSKGQIYKVVDNELNVCYIGSTTQKLCKRMAQHRKDFKKYLNDSSYKNTSIFTIFQSYGVENCKIELIEKYPCESKEDLMAREGYFIKAIDCVNKRIAGRSSKERYEDNKEVVLAKCKIYREHEDRKEQIKEKKRQNYQNKREYYLEKAKIYRDNHKEERKEYDKQRRRTKH